MWMRIHLDGGTAITVTLAYSLHEIGRVIVDGYDVRVFGTMGGILAEVNCYPSWPYNVDVNGLGLFSQRSSRAFSMNQQ